MGNSAQEPISITLDSGTVKLPGYIMKVTLTGLLVELEKLNFKVGTYFTGVFELETGYLITERMRSVKHYDKFFRTAPKKKLKQGEVAPVPKKLVEFHFHDVTEATKTQITKYQLRLKRDQESRGK